jgi:ubiquinone/menaquinone biosynthesis C-methylase UbiE
LQQAARVFSKNSKLKFVYGDIFSGLLNDLKFDAIVFAASIQYFPDLSEILNVSINQLYTRGEIHITDTPIYKPAGLGEAKERTSVYYNSLGFPEMTKHYFHHCITELSAFHPKILHNPFSIKTRFLPKNHPFYWICIQKK